MPRFRRVRPDAEAFKAALERHDCERVYHWTRGRSLVSILTHGIRPQRYLLANGIPFESHRYGRYPLEDLVRRKEYGGHVAVSFLPLETMFRSLDDAVVLSITSKILLIEGAFFSPVNTGFTPLSFDFYAKRTAISDFEQLYQGATSGELGYPGSEAWIPDIIGLPGIEGIRFTSSYERDRVLPEIEPELPRLPALRFVGLLDE